MRNKLLLCWDCNLANSCCCIINRVVAKFKDFWLWRLQVWQTIMYCHLNYIQPVLGMKIRNQSSLLCILFREVVLRMWHLYKTRIYCKFPDLNSERTRTTTLPASADCSTVETCRKASLIHMIKSLSKFFRIRLNSDLLMSYVPPHPRSTPPFWKMQPSSTT